MSLSELVGLNLAALDLRAAVVRVVERLKRERIVLVGRLTQENLCSYLDCRADLLLGLDVEAVEAGAVFINTRGRRLTRRSVQRVVERHLRPVSPNRRCSPQILRHSSAAHLVAAGADLAAVKDMLGHDSLASTQCYCEVNPEQLRQGYQRAHPRS